jgi:hypothetical protein
MLAQIAAYGMCEIEIRLRSPNNHYTARSSSALQQAYQIRKPDD